jgi:hypothetical protein
MVQEKYRSCQTMCFCGVFPEIRRAWASIDNCLYLWRYDRRCVAPQYFSRGPVSFQQQLYRGRQPQQYRGRQPQQYIQVHVLLSAEWVGGVDPPHARNGIRLLASLGVH